MQWLQFNECHVLYYNDAMLRMLCNELHVMNIIKLGDPERCHNQLNCFQLNCLLLYFIDCTIL